MLVKESFNKNPYGNYGIFILFAAILVITPELSFADDVFGGILCNILSTLTGTPAKVIATLAIIFLGISAFFGRLQWGTALLVGVGIAAIFGAAILVTTIAGSGTGGCNTLTSTVT